MLLSPPFAVSLEISQPLINTINSLTFELLFNSTPESRNEKCSFVFYDHWSAVFDVLVAFSAKTWHAMSLNLATKACSNHMVGEKKNQELAQRRKKKSRIGLLLI